MLEIVFLTSSRAKRYHLQFLARGYPIIIGRQKNYGQSYIEPRVRDRRELLRRSFEDAYERWKKYEPGWQHKFFLIEDTSVRIEALSAEEDFPGVDIKFWMKDHDFSSLDRELKSFGNDRRAMVRSDMLLGLPIDLQRKIGRSHIHVIGRSYGTIVDYELNIKTQPAFPWLDNKTFNKWFVPRGEVMPLSALPVERAIRGDFRARAFKKIIDFLERHRLLSVSSDQSLGHQSGLTVAPLSFIICGPTCSGKTTIADYLANKFGYWHIEASDFMYMSYREHLGLHSDVSIGEFAKRILEDNPAVVVNKVLETLKSSSEIPFVVTGFRSPTEVEIFKSRFGGSCELRVVYVDADEQIRFIRNLERNRHDKDLKLCDFRRKNKQQDSMGLSRIKGISDLVVVNDFSDLSEYYDSFFSNYRSELESIRVSSEVASAPAPRLEERIILSLYFSEQDRMFTTTQIARRVNDVFGGLYFSTNKNNVSRYFNQRFHPYYEIDVGGDGKRRYGLSQTGRGRALVLRRFYNFWLRSDRPLNLVGVNRKKIERTEGPDQLALFEDW